MYFQVLQLHHLCKLQLDWKVVPINLKDVLRSSTMERGVQFVMIIGTSQMPGEDTIMKGPLRYLHHTSYPLSVVCRQLGFGDAIRAYTRSFFGGVDTRIPIWLDEVQCSASDNYVSECRHNGWRNNDCSHSEDAGVACTGSSEL